ncbi:MAG TPA: hypothetical protein VNX68_02080 [Nitrosopumilaceae archaeon]|jgi:hypothetical protein|nr:hypothetical protein [Nitrosopumilaceae archaeon]
MNEENEKIKDESESPSMEISSSTVPVLYTWIRNNILSFFFISAGLLALYGAYEFIQGYVRPFGASLVTQHEELKRAVSSFTALDNIIQKPLVAFKASRVGLYRFHDSQKDLSRMAFFFCSIANIVAAPGVEIDLPAVTNLPAATFAPVLPSLVEQKTVFLITKDMSSGALKELDGKRGVKMALFVGINDLEDNLIGFLQVDWLAIEDVPTGAERETMINSLEGDTKRISGYFSLGSIKDK